MNIAEVLKLEETKEVTGEWRGIGFTFSCYPARYSSPVVMQGLDEGLNGRPLRLADALSVLLAEWDLDWNGEPFPPSRENLTICPLDFLVYLADLAVPQKEEVESGKTAVGS